MSQRPRHTGVARLSGFDEPTPLGIERRSEGDPIDLASDFDERELALDPDESRALVELCRSRRITLGTLIQGAWALLLSRYSGRSEVLFGVTVAGRPPELPGSEAMIGLFINTMPLRVAVDEASGLFDWLVRLQEQMVELRRFEAVPLARNRGWSRIASGVSMFESLVTVQNLPFMEALRQRAGRLGVEAPRFFERTHYPISLTALTDDRLRLRIGFDARRYDADPIERILGHLGGLLKAMARARTVGSTTCCGFPIASRSRRVEASPPTTPWTSRSRTWSGSTRPNSTR